MAELLRQVEVQCSERAHAVALTWNLFSAAVDTCHGLLHYYPHLGIACCLRHCFVTLQLIMMQIFCDDGLFERVYVLEVSSNCDLFWSAIADL